MSETIDGHAVKEEAPNSPIEKVRPEPKGNGSAALASESESDDSFYGSDAPDDNYVRLALEACSRPLTPGVDQMLPKTVPIDNSSNLITSISKQDGSHFASRSSTANPTRKTNIANNVVANVVSKHLTPISFRKAGALRGDLSTLVLSPHLPKSSKTDDLEFPTVNLSSKGAPQNDGLPTEHSSRLNTGAPGRFSHDSTLPSYQKLHDYVSSHFAIRGSKVLSAADLPHGVTEITAKRRKGGFVSPVRDSNSNESGESNDPQVVEEEVAASVRNESFWVRENLKMDMSSNNNGGNKACKVSAEHVFANVFEKLNDGSVNGYLSWFYRNIPLLHLLDDEDLACLVPLSLRREYTCGDIILEPKTQLHHLYTVVWGTVEVFRAKPIATASEDGERALASLGIAHHECLLTKVSKCKSREQSISVSTLEENSAMFESNTLYSHVATLEPGQFFGLGSLVYDEPAKYLFQTGSTTTKTVLSLLPFDELLRALARNPRFAQGAGSVIADSIDVFGPIRQFCRIVFAPNSLQNEYLPLWSIVQSYTMIENVIHTKLFSKEIDTGAWGYAVNRLPENLTSTFCFDLVYSLPPFIASRMRVEARAADVLQQRGSSSLNRGRTKVVYIRTKDRRRCSWSLGMEGKTLVLLRDGFTDLLDFLTMLCIHIIESNKLRGRVQGMVHPPAIDILDEYMRAVEEEERQQKKLTVEEEMVRIKDVLHRMPLSQEEQDGLIRNWGTSTLMRIYEVMFHREEYNVRIDPSISRKFQTNPFHEWCLNLRACVLEKLGMERFSELPEGLSIDIISSNKHCIKNLLCNFTRKYKKEIKMHAWTCKEKGIGDPNSWFNKEDLLYAALGSFFRTCRPDLKEEYSKSLELSGITVLDDTAMTGLQVEVIPVHALDLASIDESLQESLQKYYKSDLSSEGEPVKVEPQRNRSLRHFIINMDFAFGAQAEGICRALFAAFGKHVRSVNVVGKAGGLVGKRGDIQLASHVLLSKSSLIMGDNQDELRNCRNQDISIQRLKELTGQRCEVHHGKVLTVTGTILQNVRLLKYYRRVWRCVGVEMEGSYFARAIEDLYRQGIACAGLKTRFMYYTSDLPLAESEKLELAQTAKLGTVPPLTLSASMGFQEGVPPLYAIARATLENILLP